ncbi:molecular chaperone [Embleya sp. NPDC056575]|uniref:fimbrial biogenesis chaperone n=1 Tax=unclassified Embleya TaxID=2699296 RepID=UPI003676192E
MAVVLTTSRVLFDASVDPRQAAVVVRNTGDEPVVVQTFVSDRQGDAKVPFASTPSVVRLNEATEQAVVVRRVHVKGSDVPADREALFRFNAKVVPSMRSDQAATTLTIPLFHRPTGLAGDPAAAPGRLSISQEDGKLTLTNPTPFFVTLASLSVGEDTLDIGESALIPPLGGTVSYALPSDTTAEVGWTAISDSGTITPWYHE